MDFQEIELERKPISTKGTPIQIAKFDMDNAAFSGQDCVLDPSSRTKIDFLN
jgi:hypothetical protein